DKNKIRGPTRRKLLDSSGAKKPSFSDVSSQILINVSSCILLNDRWKQWFCP
ncbi:hypothetical protein Leryth_018125, partial [Lithospermum erythrorhizon]